VLVADEEVEYLYCERCAKVTAVSPDRLDPVRARILQELGYEARFTHFAIVGVCEECAAARPLAGHSREQSTAHHGPLPSPTREPLADHEHLHSHGDHVHSHPHTHGHTGAVHHH
jgi:hypothetical protein